MTQSTSLAGVWSRRPFVVLGWIVVFVALALTVGPRPASAAVAPPSALDARDQVGATPDPERLRATLRPEAVDFYVRTHGVRRDEATRRLVDQQRVIGLGPVLEQRFGSTVGEPWYDNEQGMWVVPVADAASRGKVERELDRLGLAAGSYRIDTATRGAAEERRAVDAAAKALRPLIERRRVSVGKPKGSARITISEDASSDDERRAREVAEDVGATIDRTSHISEARPQISCSFPYCDTLLGGVRFSDANGGCTTGFYVGPPGFYDPHILTAGHCTDVGAQWWTCHPGGANCVVSGYETAARYFGAASGVPGDAGLLHVTYNQNNGGWALYPGYFNWNPAPPFSPSASPVRAYYSTNAPNGLVVCLNGATSGSTCGQIADNLYPFSWNGNDFSGMLRITGACVRPGDSGGPWTGASYEVAVGVHYGGGTCDGTAAAEPVGRALVHLNASIYGQP